MSDNVDYTYRPLDHLVKFLIEKEGYLLPGSDSRAGGKTTNALHAVEDVIEVVCDLRAELASTEEELEDEIAECVAATKRAIAAEQREKRLREAAKRVEPILNALRRDNEIRGYDQPEIRDAHDRLRAALAEEEGK